MLAVTFYNWLLVFHLLSAFAVASALVLFSVLVFNSRRMTTLAETQVLFRVAPVGTVLIGAGLLLVLVFGAILAFDSGTFEIWDGWVIAGIVLWAAFAAVGQRTGEYYIAIQKLAQSPEEGTEAEVLARLHASTGALLNLASIAIFLLLLLDMIFKPGA
jgi:drug/metabolite transporter (DMT)-like permease